MCITQSGSNQWSGLLLPRAPGPDYTVTVRGRLTDGSWGWGVMVRAAWSASDGTVSGHAIQYDEHLGGYLDTDYPGNTRNFYPGAIDGAWHTLTVTVRGSQYAVQVDGKPVAHGSLSETGNGAYIHVWNSGTVELLTPAVTRS